MAPGAEKAVNSRRTVVVESRCVSIEEHLMPAFDMQRAPKDMHIAVAPQALALAFAEGKSIKPDTQQNHPAGFTAPLPVIAPENQIRPITPAVFAKPVEHHGVHGLHLDIILDVVRIERYVVKNR